MTPPLRPLAALVLAAFVACPAFAQDEGENPDHEKREIIVERDGDVYRFRVPDDDPMLRRWLDDERPFHADTVIDGRHVIRFRLPGGREESFAFEVPDFDTLAFREHLRPEIERFRHVPPDLSFDLDGEPLGLPRFRFDDWVEGLRGLGGVSDETRDQMRELERRARDLADQARDAEGRERDALERELDEVLGQLFEVRGRMREEQAQHLEERADRLRDEAEALRQSLHERDRERRALIEERKRELLGEPGPDW